MSSRSYDGTSEDGDIFAAKACDAENQFVGTRHLGIINSKRHLDPSHMSRVNTGKYNCLSKDNFNCTNY